MSDYDPLEFLIPLIIHSRILMQDVWISGITWDKELKQAEFERWKKWLRDLNSIENVKIPRCYYPINANVKSVELHVFCDASFKAYSAVAYFRFILDNDLIHSSIIISKSRVIPIKPVSSIHRLELQAAVLGSRIANIVLKENVYDISRKVFRTDSKTVLFWIQKILVFSKHML